MTESDIKRRDYIQAEVQGRLSTFTMAFPFLRRLTEQSTPHVSLRWYHARMPVSQLTNKVTISAAGSEAGLTPKHYPEAAIIGLPKEEIDDRRNQGYIGLHVVAYALGSTVMVGEEIDDRAHEDPFTAAEDGEHYLVAMGIGKGALIASGGLGNHSGRELWIPEEPIVILDRLPVDQIPLGIHLV